MTVSKRERQKQNRELRRAAEEAARKKAARRRQLMLVLIVGGVVAGLALLISWVRGDSSETATTTNTTTSTAVAVSKQCVPVADPLPAGAPAVPVKVGPSPTELVKDDLKVGTGPEVTPGSTVTVNYIGVACSTGKIFDSSYSRNQPATFSLSQVIKGWTDGIPGMKVGGQRLLGIPAAQAYGPSGSPAAGIGPDEPLWFVVEVTDTKPS